MSRFFSSRCAGLPAYVPGEQPQDQPYIKLNTNESPYPPSPGVLAAVTAQAEKLCLYPDPDAGALRAALARAYGVEPENVFLSNGSDDILNFAFLAFGEAGVLAPAVTYGFYPVYAALHHLDYRTAAVNGDFSLNPEEYHGAGRMVVLANPNAQTGIALGLEAVEGIVRANPGQVVLVDEAYVDFGAQSAVELTKRYDNLLVVQTFSKSRSMAGARLGFAVGDRGLVDDLRRIQYATNPYNLNRMTQAAALAALAEQSYYDENCRRIQETRAYTRNALEALGFTCTDSLANFLLASSPELPGGQLYRRLKERGILVRHFSDERLEDWVRITIGTRNQMEALAAAVADLLAIAREEAAYAAR